MSYRKYYQYTLTRGANSIVAARNPAGWDAAGITFTRNDVYNSVLRSGIPELKFVKDLKVWLDQQIKTYGIQSSVDIEILINQVNPITLAYDIVFFEGILDLKTYKKERFFTTCDCIDNSKLAKFIARDDLEVEYNRTETINGVTVDAISNMPIEISLPGIDLYRNVKSKIQKGFTILGDVTDEQHFLQHNEFYNNDMPTSVELTNEEIYKNDTGLGTPLLVNVRGEINITGSIEFTGGGGYMKLYLTIYSTSGGGIPTPMDNETYEYFGNTGDTENINETFSLNKSVNTVNDDTILICIEVTSISATASINSESDPFFIFEESGSIGAKNCNGFLPHELASRLLQVITDETDSTKLLYSTLLGRTDSEFQTYASDGDAAYMFLTNGYYIRRLNQKSFKTTFKNFFKALKSWYPAGLWYDATNDYFTIESLSEFYQNTEILDLGEVKDLVIRPATDIYYNSIKTGYQKKVEYKEYNGVNEINTPAEYTTVISTIKNTLDLQSPYRGDSVGIELAKRAGQYSKDTDYDNDNFVIDCKLDGSNIIVNQDTVATSDDIPGIEQYFNLRFTPKTIMLNNADLLTPCLEKNQLSYIRFANNQQDNDITRGTVTEKGNHKVIDIFNPYVVPRVFDFKFPMTNDIVNQLNSNPHGYITFTNNGNTYHMFLLECGKGGYRKEGNWLGIEANLS